jgi:hypothetical protein
VEWNDNNFAFMSISTMDQSRLQITWMIAGDRKLRLVVVMTQKLFLDLESSYR